MSITIGAFISLDGVVQAPGGPDEDTDGGFAHGGWSHEFFDPELVPTAFDPDLTGSTALLFGRRTWQGMADAWPGRAGDPYADKMNAIRKYVVSGSLAEEDLRWNTTLVPAEGALDRLAELSEKENLLVMGNPVLSQALIGADLADELRLVTMPVLLGGGKTLFPAGGTKRRFQLVENRTGANGTIVRVYSARGADGA